MSPGQKTGAAVLAAVVAVGVGIRSVGDDALRMVDDIVRSSDAGVVKVGDDFTPPPHFPPPPPAPHFPTPAPTPPTFFTNDVDSAISEGGMAIGQEFGRRTEPAREAAKSVACGVVAHAIANGNIPAAEDWLGIAIDALEASLGIEVAVGSVPWFELAVIESRVTSEIADLDGKVDIASAEELGSDLGCDLITS